MLPAPATDAGSEAGLTATADGDRSNLPGKAGSRDSQGINRKIVSNPDGTSDEFRRSANHSEIVRISRDASGSLFRQIIYRIGKSGSISSSEIFDPRGVKLAKVRYGYRKDDGKLVEEQVFDIQSQGVDTDIAASTPMRRFIHTYPAGGGVNEPICIDLSEMPPGQLIASTALLSDPFDPRPEQGR